MKSGDASISRPTGWGEARSKPSSEDAIEVENLNLSFTLQKAVLKKNRKMLKAVDNVSFTVKQGEVFGLVGESGSGKSTVARLIAGLYRPDSGTIRVKGTDITTKPKSAEAVEARRAVQMIFQDPYSSLNARMRVMDVVAEPIRFYKMTSSEAETKQIVPRLAGSRWPRR